MAGIIPRTLLVCALPAFATLLTFLWLRKKKKANQIVQEDPKESSEETMNKPVVKEEVIFLSVATGKSSMRVNRKKTEEGADPLQSGETSKKEVTADVMVLTKLALKNLDLEDREPSSPAAVTEPSVQEHKIRKSTKSESSQEEEGSLHERSDSGASSLVSEQLESALLKNSFTVSVQHCEEPVSHDLEDIIESPPPSVYSDGHSEDSSDSGKGGSDIQVGSGNYDVSSSPLSSSGEPTSLQIYEFELAQDLCGRLIGRLGNYVNFLKSRTNTNVNIKRHPFNPQMKLCSLEGTQSEIKSSLEYIRKRFPLNQYSNVSLVQVNLPLACGVMVPETLQLHLPEGVTCDVILSSMVSAGHFFVQQPTHPTYPSLGRLDMCMASCYSQIDTPPMPQPVEVGVICSAPTLGGWYRAQVVNIYENSDECDIKFVDYGGYSCIPLSSLRQIRSDFMTLPFQASECYLANVKPIELSDNKDSVASWDLEACATFEELAQGQILQALVVGHSEDGIPCVHLYRIQGISTVFINRELVNRGIAQWVEQSQN